MRERKFGAATAVVCVLVCLLAVADHGDGAPAPAASAEVKLPARAAVDAYILGPTAMVAGARASYRVAVHWASGPKRSGPLPGAEVKLSLVKPGQRRVTLAQVRTSSAGDARLRFRVPRWKPGSGYELRVAVRSPLGRAARKQPVSLHAGGRFLLTTDKKLYQPSQTIHIRALGLRGIDLLPVAQGEVQLQVKDPKDNIVFERRLKTSRFGVASADFKLADEINLGHYTIEARGVGASVVGVASRRVEVKRYVLPKFKVSVETDRSYYQPGETVQGTVRARYFFGKPVAGAQVILGGRSLLNGGVMVHGLPILRTDAQGRATFSLHLSRHADARNASVGEVRVKATVKDSADHVERADVSVPLTAYPLSFSVVPENHALVPGIRNRVHVVAGYPDGSPARGAQVKLQLSARRVLKRRTDGLGVATFSIVPRRDGPRCGAGGMALPVAVRDKLGQRGEVRACAPLASAGAALVRPDRSMVAPGQAVELTLLAAQPRGFSDRRIYVDVVKGGQILATYSRRLRGVKARVTFQPDPTLFGLLELRAYRLTNSGERVGTSRLVFVDHPGRLKIKITPDRKTYRPGGRARLAFEVTDSRSGEGVEAALGLLAVDEAVVAMGGLPEGRSPKRFFSLAGQLRPGERGPRVRPGGRDLGHWVTAEQSSAATRARAADVLLAALRAPDAPVWETNPWKERREAWATLAPRLITSARAFMKLHSVGRRTAKGWRFHPGLVPRMARARAIEVKDARDPWRRIVRPWHLHATDKSFAFAPLARRLAPRKLERIYSALVAAWKKLKLPRERMRKLKRRRWPLVLPRDLPARLVRMGKLKPGAAIDPWGKPYRVLRNPRVFINPYWSGLVSRYHIVSAGPDGRFGTKDDVGPQGPRITVAVFGRDSALGSDAEDALGSLIGAAIGEASGVGGLGLVGTGRGGGGSGAGTIGLGRLGTIGRGGAGMPARVRSNFPETLLWRPEVITDHRGRAFVDVDLADSITTWRMLATGSSATGLLGHASATLRVFQDFFVDIDLPVALTQGDRVSVPVTIYNYLKKPQRVTLRLRREGWFTAQGSLTRTVDLKPSEVTVRYFPIVARAVGRKDLTVHASARDASGAGVADAVRRSTLVEPDGLEHATAQGGTLRGTAHHALQIPPEAISGTARVQLAIYAGPMSQTITGMEGMLRKPYGCFEQTSSSTYPNVLILDYLRRTRQLKPKIAKMAHAYINEGYQKLINFEVPGGGFSWFGRAPANKILTAYGLMEFCDMARVHKVDPRIISRTQAWLARGQRKDGSWAPDRSFINEGATNHFNKDVLRITAYIAHALRHTGYRGKALDRALNYVRARAGKATDAYTLATLGNLLAPDGDRATQKVFKALWKRRRADAKGIYFSGPKSTLTYGGGKSSQIETTALSALAYLSRPRRAAQPAGVSRIIDKLVASKDSRGSWHSTQATILSLRALLLNHERSRSKPAGEVQVLVDGKLFRRVKLRADQDRAHQLDLTRLVGTGGQHAVALRFAGKGSLQYQLVGRYWLPRRAQAAEKQAASKSAQLAIVTSYHRRRVKKGGDLRLDVAIRNRGGGRVEMPLVDLALPPGFTLQRDALAGLVRAGRVEKVQRVGTRALLYLTKLKPRQSMRFSLNLTSKYPLRVQARPSVIYEYYKPENRAQSRATTLQVL